MCFEASICISVITRSHCSCSYYKASPCMTVITRTHHAWQLLQGRTMFNSYYKASQWMTVTVNTWFHYPWQLLQDLSYLHENYYTISHMQDNNYCKRPHYTLNLLQCLNTHCSNYMVSLFTTVITKPPCSTVTAGPH
jgi:hypothetical protein